MSESDYAPMTNGGDEQALERNLPFEFLCLLLLFPSRARDASPSLGTFFSLFLYIHSSKDYTIIILKMLFFLFR
jgi:hypothetical protein